MPNLVRLFSKFFLTILMMVENLTQSYWRLLRIIFLVVSFTALSTKYVGKLKIVKNQKIKKEKKEKLKKTTISSDLAKGKDMGKVGKEYGKFIQSIVKYEEYVRSEKIPNVELGAESAEIATAYLELSKVYESIIEAASIYEEHRKSIKSRIFA